MLVNLTCFGTDSNVEANKNLHVKKVYTQKKKKA